MAEKHAVLHRILHNALTLKTLSASFPGMYALSISKTSVIRKLPFHSFGCNLNDVSILLASLIKLLEACQPPGPLTVLSLRPFDLYVSQIVNSLNCFQLHDRPLVPNDLDFSPYWHNELPVLPETPITNQSNLHRISYRFVTWSHLSTSFLRLRFLKQHTIFVTRVSCSSISSLLFTEHTILLLPFPHGLFVKVSCCLLLVV